MQKRKLAIYDFDNTLCMTSAQVHCEDKKAGTKFSMNARSYTEWRETDDYNSDPHRYELDFSEFQGYPTNCSKNFDIIKFLKNDILDPYTVPALVTGRDELSGPKLWLKDNNIKTEAMFLLCSADPNKKPCYESLINTFNPDEVIIYEDGFCYINQCREVCNKYNLPLSAIHIISPKEFRAYNYKNRE